MHIFDIRRSNSVTELWKKFECNAQLSIRQSTEISSARHEGAPSVFEADVEGDNGQSTSAPTEPSEPLLAAFEAELARILHETPEAYSTSNEARGESSFSASVQERTTASDRPQSPAATFAQTVRNMVNGAQFISSDLRSRIPDLERQLWDIQRAVPGHVENTMQSALTAMEPGVRNLVETLNSAAAAADERSNNLARGSPMAATTINSLRTMASDIGQLGHSLFTTFESELGCNFSREQEQRTSGESAGSSRLDGQAHPSAVEAPADAPGAVPENQQSHLRGLQRNEKECSGLNKEEASSERDSKLPGIDEETSSSTPMSQFDPWYQPPTSQQAHHYPPGGPHHKMPVPSFNTFRPPPPKPFHVPPPPPMFSPPLPSMPGPSCQTSPANPPWSHFPPHPPPPLPHPQQAWRPGWPHGPKSHPCKSACARPRRHASQTLQTREIPNKTLFVGNVGFNVTEDMIRGIFASQGFIVEVHLPVEHETGKHAGFGYLSFPSIHAAKGALAALQGMHIDGHSINLEFSDNSPITSVQASRHDGQSTSQADLTSRKAGKLPESRELVDTSTEATTGSSTADLPPSASGANDLSSTRPGNSGLLGRENEDSEFSARYPSLVPEPTRQSPSIDEFKPGHVSSLSPESHMDRFPPVSQLDAHMVADQRLNEGKREAKANIRSAHSHPYSSRPTARESGFKTASHMDRKHQSRYDPQLRRTASMMSPRLGSSARPETHSALYSDDQLSRDLKRVSLKSNQFGKLGSLPSKAQPPQNSTSSHYDEPPSTINRIDKCVETLISLGYGGSEEGGHHRLGVYAAAADGKVNDAIEMIEDERKVYEQRKS